MTEWAVRELAYLDSLEEGLNELAKLGYHPFDVKVLRNSDGNRYFLVIASREIKSAKPYCQICGGAGLTTILERPNGLMAVPCLCQK
jgi:hypothetical protein